MWLRRAQIGAALLALVMFVVSVGELRERPGRTEWEILPPVILLFWAMIAVSIYCLGQCIKMAIVSANLRRVALGLIAWGLLILYAALVFPLTLRVSHRAHNGPGHWGCPEMESIMDYKVALPFPPDPDLSPSPEESRI